MIEKLKKKDIVEAAKVYNKGLRMEIPKGHNTLNYTKKYLKEIYCFVYKENNKILGLVSFKFKTKDKIQMDFICAIKLRKGIGKKLIIKLKEFAVNNKVKMIYSNVSSKDKRVLEFYKNCGFKTYSKYYANKSFMLYRIKSKPEWIK